MILAGGDGRALSSHPARSSYDAVIVGGAMMGSGVAWFLSRNPDFNGTALVVERDPFRPGGTGPATTMVSE